MLTLSRSSIALLFQPRGRLLRGFAAGVMAIMVGGAGAVMMPTSTVAATDDTCALPSTYDWTSTGPLAQPQPGWVSLKDFTHTPYNGRHLVYATTHATDNTLDSLNLDHSYDHIVSDHA